MDKWERLKEKLKGDTLAHIAGKYVREYIFDEMKLMEDDKNTENFPQMTDAQAEEIKQWWEIEIKGTECEGSLKWQIAWLLAERERLLKITQSPVSCGECETVKNIQDDLHNMELNRNLFYNMANDLLERFNRTAKYKKR